MTQLTTLLKGFRLSKFYYYGLIALLGVMLIAENLLGYNIPLFYVSEENAGVFILSLVGLGVLAYKGDFDNAATQEQANENALAAIAIALNIKLEELKEKIDDIKLLQAA